MTFAEWGQVGPKKVGYGTRGDSIVRPFDDRTEDEARAAGPQAHPTLRAIVDEGHEAELEAVLAQQQARGPAFDPNSEEGRAAELADLNRRDPFLQGKLAHQAEAASTLALPSSKARPFVPDGGKRN